MTAVAGTTMDSHSKGKSSKAWKSHKRNTLTCFLTNSQKWQEWVCRDIHDPRDSIFRQSVDKTCLLCGLKVQNKKAWKRHCGGDHHRRTFSLLQKIKELEEQSFIVFVEKAYEAERLFQPKVTPRQKRAFFNHFISGISKTEHLDPAFLRAKSYFNIFTHDSIIDGREEANADCLKPTHSSDTYETHEESLQSEEKSDGQIQLLKSMNTMDKRGNDDLNPKSSVDTCEALENSIQSENESIGEKARGNESRNTHPDVLASLPQQRHNPSTIPKELEFVASDMLSLASESYVNNSPIETSSHEGESKEKDLEEAIAFWNDNFTGDKTPSTIKESEHSVTLVELLSPGLNMSSTLMALDRSRDVFFLGDIQSPSTMQVTPFAKGAQNNTCDEVEKEIFKCMAEEEVDTGHHLLDVGLDICTSDVCHVGEIYSPSLKNEMKDGLGKFSSPAAQKASSLAEETLFDSTETASPHKPRSILQLEENEVRQPEDHIDEAASASSDTDDSEYCLSSEEDAEDDKTYHDLFPLSSRLSPTSLSTICEDWNSCNDRSERATSCIAALAFFDAI